MDLSILKYISKKNADVLIYNLNTDVITALDTQNINTTNYYVRQFIIDNHRNIFSILNVTGEYYFINMNNILDHSLSDAGEINILFTDNTELNITCYREIETTQNYYFLKKQLTGLNLDEYSLTRNKVYVDPGFSTTATTFSSLQTAIETVEANTFIHVYPGTYSEVVINKNLDIYLSADAIILGNSGNAVTITSNAEVNIFGYGTITAESSYSCIDCSDPDCKIYIEFDTMQSDEAYTNIVYEGDIFLKGLLFTSSTSDNMFEVSQGINIFDILYITARGQNYQTNFFDADENTLIMFKNVQFESDISNNINLEHTEDIIANFEHCFFICDTVDSNVTTISGGSITGFDFIVNDCVFYSPGAQYDVYAYDNTGIGGDAGIIRWNIRNSCRGQHGLRALGTGNIIQGSYDYTTDSSIDLENLRYS